MADFPEHTAQEVEVWVHAQMWNWSAWCWDGPWPHPLPVITCASAERHYRPRAPDEEDRGQPVRRVIHEGHARLVDGIYQSLPLVEQRIVQFEYPRRYEFDEFNYRGELLRNVRVQKGCRILRIKQMYYHLALNNMLELVKQAFLKQEAKV